MGLIRAVTVAAVVMGLLIVAGVAVIATTLVSRMSGGGTPVASVLLDEPMGTGIMGLALAPDRMAVQLRGGGPDRVVVVDTRTGRIVNRTGLSH